MAGDENETPSRMEVRKLLCLVIIDRIVTLESTGDIQVNSSITTDGGVATAKADNDLLFGASGSLDTAGGTALLQADAVEGADGDGGALAMSDGSWVNSGSGTIALGARVTFLGGDPPDDG